MAVTQDPESTHRPGAKVTVSRRTSRVDALDRMTKRLSEVLYHVAGAAIVAMMLLTCADIVLRYFGHPVPGTYELVSFLAAIAVSFALAHTFAQGGHVAVTLFTDHMPRRGVAACGVLASVLTF